MPIFEDYAKYYDILYHEKDYKTEANFVLDQLSKLSSRPTTILDLGCGTGRHALEFARRGRSVTGVDLSDVMIRLAKERVQCEASNVVFREGDARSVRLESSYDAVVSLFHVMSYQCTEDDALCVFETAFNHLKRDGLFFFDFWHGPGVLTDRPESRDLYIDHGGTELLRHAEPTLFVDKNKVDVNYCISLKKGGETFSSFKETHSMRYWFLPELNYLASQAGFSVVGSGQWLSNNAVSDRSWLAWVAAKRL